MFRLTLMLLVLTSVMFAGCTSSIRLTECDGVEPVTLYLEDDGQLVENEPSSGVYQSAGAVSTLGSDVDVWPTSNPLSQGIVVTGDVEVEFWARAEGVSLFSTEGDQAYQFYTLFGSDVALAPGGDLVEDRIIQIGDIVHFQQTLRMPAGGTVVLNDESVQLVLASVVQTRDGGHEILTGGSTPSQVRFMAECIPPLDYAKLDSAGYNVNLVGNQALFTGIVPGATGLNTVHVPFTLDPEAKMLDIQLHATQDRPGKDDIDMWLLDADGLPVWQATSPSQDERMRLWQDNLELSVPAGEYTVRVDSYSGLAYRGRLTIDQFGP